MSAYLGITDEGEVKEGAGIQTTQGKHTTGAIVQHQIRRQVGVQSGAVEEGELSRDPVCTMLDTNRLMWRVISRLRGQKLGSAQLRCFQGRWRSWMTVKLFFAIMSMVVLYRAMETGQTKGIQMKTLVRSFFLSSCTRPK